MRTEQKSLLNQILIFTSVMYFSQHKHFLPFDYFYIQYQDCFELHIVLQNN